MNAAFRDRPACRTRAFRRWTHHRPVGPWEAYAPPSGLHSARFPALRCLRPWTQLFKLASRSIPDRTLGFAGGGGATGTSAVCAAVAGEASLACAETIPASVTFSERAFTGT